MPHTIPVKWQGWFPQRYVFVSMGALAIFCAYTMRMAMSVAITEMATQGNATAANADDAAEFDWDEAEQGLVLGGLFWGYVLLNVPCGLMADRFGGKRLLFFGIMTASVATMLIPVAARYGGANWVIVARFIEGAGESAAYPGNNNMLAFWGPAQERSLMGSVVFSGNLLGQVVGTALSGEIIEYSNDWATVFYVFGGVGLVWCALFYILCYDTPAQHPWISDDERHYIETSIKATSTKRPSSIPWKDILLSWPVWALIVGQLGHDWALFTLGTELPKYMKSVLKYDVATNGLISALPNLMTWLSAFVSGWISDWLIRTERISILMHRRSFTVFSCVLPGVGLLAASYAGTDEGDRAIVVALFCVGMAGMGPFYSALKVNALDISPNYSGLVMSIVNGLGAVSGIVSPYIVGLLIPEETVEEWRSVFWVTLAVCVISSVFYCYFCSTEPQAWNSVGEGGEFLEEADHGSPKKDKKEMLDLEPTAVV